MEKGEGGLCHLHVWMLVVLYLCSREQHLWPVTRGGVGDGSVTFVYVVLCLCSREQLCRPVIRVGVGDGSITFVYVVLCSREQLWRPVTRVGESLSSLVWLQQARRFQHDHSSLLLAESGEDLHLEVLFL